MTCCAIRQASFRVLSSDAPYNTKRLPHFFVQQALSS